MPQGLQLREHEQEHVRPLTAEPTIRVRAVLFLLGAGAIIAGPSDTEPNQMRSCGLLDN
jgi:hypothetical protein